jgi:uncharacterized protein YdhG (YjbR/CyaY superfamily)
MPVMRHFTSVDAYISDHPSELQSKLRQLRQTILKAAPGADENISYSMPAYKYLGRPLVYFAAFKNHIGFYALPQAIRLFADQLSGYETSKGTIQFPLNKPLPLNLIKQLVRFRVEENKEMAEAKQAAKKTKVPAVHRMKA